jgi:hypothetical protein
MRLLWMRIKPQDANFDLAREIARRFRILEQPPEHDLAWIYTAAERALLVEAA